MRLALLLPLAIALVVAGPRLGNRAIAMSGWLGWVVAGSILLGLPSVPPHSAFDYRMVLTPVLLLPMLAPKRWAVATLALSAALTLGFGLQSLWGRSTLLESLAIGTLAGIALLGRHNLPKHISGEIHVVGIIKVRKKMLLVVAPISFGDGPDIRHHGTSPEPIPNKPVPGIKPFTRGGLHRLIGQLPDVL